MATNLTTLFLLKRFMGTASDADDDLLERLIDDVCAQMAKVCDRTFESTSYRQWLDGNGSTRILLPQYPVTSLFRVSITTNDAVREVKYSGSGKHADVTVTSTGVIMRHVDAAGAVQSSTILFSTYPIITSLGTAISGVSDWSCSVQSGYEYEPSQLLCPMQGVWALNPDDAELLLPDDGVGVRISSQSERMIERVGGGTFPCGRHNIFVWYVAGYTLPVDDGEHSELTTTGDVPGGLTQLANEIVRDVYKDRKKSSGVKQFRLADWGETRDAVLSAVERRKADLSPYMRKTL
jgi:hypothetical protein